MPVRADVIEKRGSKWVLLSHDRSKVLGEHATKEEAEAQERAVQAHKHADGGERVRRFDVGTLAPPERLPNGWLRVEGHTARTGILDYVNGDGTTRRELVLPEELFAPDSIDSARMVPVTDTHPDRLLDAATVKAHAVGSVGENLRRDGELLAAPLMITVESAVKDVLGGRSQLSWGYDCEIDATQDPELIAKWGPYDAIQRRRRYNHLALVDSARAGDRAALRLDAKDACMLVSAQSSAAPFAPPTPPEKSSMAQIRIDGLAFNADEANAANVQAAIDKALAAAASRADKATAALATAEKARADADARIDAVKGAASRKVKAFKAHIDDMKARMMGCDECGGSGKVMDDDAERKCDYCDGKGAVRMHEIVKALKGADEVVGEDDDDMAHPDDDLAEMEEEDDGLEQEPKSEEELERAANAKHHDKKKRADARKAAQKRRADSLARMTIRAAKARASLLTVAAKHVDAASLTGSEVEIKRAVVAKLAPHLDAKSLSVAEVGVIYKSELARLDAANANLPSAVDNVRAGVHAPVATPARVATLDDAMSARHRANESAWQRTAAK